MGYLDEMRAAQKKVQDLINTQSANIDPQLAQSKDIVLAQRAKNVAGIKAGLGKTVSDLGLDAAVGNPTAGEFAFQDKSKLNPNLDSSYDQARLDAKRKSLNQSFNFAFDNFVKAGMDTQTAYERARAIALNQSAQDTETILAKRGREYKQEASRKKQATSYQLSGLNMIAPPDPYQAQVVNALFNFGTTVGTGAYLNKKLNPGNPSSASFGPSGPVGPGSSLSEESGFLPTGTPSRFSRPTYLDRFNAGGY